MLHCATPSPADRASRARESVQEARPGATKPRAAMASVIGLSAAVEADGMTESQEPPPAKVEASSVATDPEPAVEQPVAPAPVQEFDPVASQPVPSAAPAGADTGAPSPGGSGAGAGSAAAENEFGP